MNKLFRKINYKFHENEINNFTYAISILYAIVESREFELNDKNKEAFYDTVVALQKYNEENLMKGELTKIDLEIIRESLKNIYENYIKIIY